MELPIMSSRLQLMTKSDPSTKISNRPKFRPHTPVGVELGIELGVEEGISEGYVVGENGAGVGDAVGGIIHCSCCLFMIPYSVPEATFKPFNRTLYPPVPFSQHRPSFPASYMTNV